MTSGANMSVFELQWSVVFPLYSVYIALGSLAIASNVLACCVYASSKVLRLRCTLLIVLCVTDLINGFAFVLSGVQRLNLVQQMHNVYGFPMVKRAYCARQLHNVLMIVGSQWPSCVVFCIGMERFLAVTFPFKFSAMRDRNIGLVVGLTALLTLLSVTVGVISGSVVKGNDEVYFSCTVNRSFGDAYGTFNYSITIFGHTFGFFFSCSAFCYATNWLQKSKIRLCLAISILSVCLVSLPNVLLYVAKFHRIDNRILGYVYCLFCFRSALNFVTSTAFSRDFNAQIRHLTARIFPARQATTEVTHLNQASSVGF